MTYVAPKNVPTSCDSWSFGGRGILCFDLAPRKLTHWVLTAYVVAAPGDVIPLLILNSYQCHMIASVVSVLIRHYENREGSHIYDWVCMLT